MDWNLGTDCFRVLIRPSAPNSLYSKESAFALYYLLNAAAMMAIIFNLGADVTDYEFFATANILCLLSYC